LSYWPTFLKRSYLTSLCNVRFLSNRQYLFSSSRCGVSVLFFAVV